MIKGEKIYFKNEIVEIIDIKEEWTSYPHGSGITYHIYTFERGNKERFEYNDCYSEYKDIRTINGLEKTNKYLEEKIENIKEEIKQNTELLLKLQSA